MSEFGFQRTQPQIRTKALEETCQSQLNLSGSCAWRCLGGKPLGPGDGWGRLPMVAHRSLGGC